MGCRFWLALGTLAVASIFGPKAHAGDLKIKIPKRSQLTPVQRLNREGVEELRKHNYERAESLFDRAYLLDPDDPFTLNNLGYVSEIQGRVDDALRFYDLAAEPKTEAAIDLSTSRSLVGLPIRDALAAGNSSLQLNHDNVEAVRLLSQGRAPEADLLLQQNLSHDPQNVFTLNNLGVSKEMEGESQEALRYYDAAAATRSDASAVVTLDRSWRGKPASQMAARNAKALRAWLESENTVAARAAELNLRGVSAVNRNDVSAANQAFRQAYALDPNNPFALNNMGYVAELEGDRETAQFFYDAAQKAGGANLDVGLATRRSAEGLRLSEVANESNTKVERAMGQERDVLRKQHRPVVLLRRDNSIVEEPNSPPAPTAPRPPQ
jgi:Flp pilus assembly protein TadD